MKAAEGPASSVWSVERLVERALEVAGDVATPPEKKPLRMPRWRQKRPRRPCVSSGWTWVPAPREGERDARAERTTAAT